MELLPQSLGLCLIFISHFLAAEAVSYPWPKAWSHVKWLMGKWRSEYDGKITWPTTPTTTYGEYLEFTPAPLSLENGVAMIRVMSYSWSHSTKDRLLEMNAFMHVKENGEVLMISTMNNGFNTLENGTATYGLVKLKLAEIGRINIARQIPTEDTLREFRLINNEYMEQILSMRTAQHPAVGVLEHARILYKRYVDPVTTTPAPTTTTRPPVTQPVVETGPVGGVPEDQTGPGQERDPSFFEY